MSSVGKSDVRVNEITEDWDMVESEAPLPSTPAACSIDRSASKTYPSDTKQHPLSVDVDMSEQPVQAASKSGGLQSSASLPKTTSDVTEGRSFKQPGHQNMARETKVTTERPPTPIAYQWLPLTSPTTKLCLRHVTSRHMNAPAICVSARLAVEQALYEAIHGSPMDFTLTQSRGSEYSSSENSHFLAASHSSGMTFLLAGAGKQFESMTGSFSGTISLDEGGQ